MDQSIDIINYYNHFLEWVETLDPLIKNNPSYKINVFNNKRCQYYQDLLNLESIYLLDQDSLITDITVIYDKYPIKNKDNYILIINEIKELKIGKYYKDENQLKLIYKNRIEKLAGKKFDVMNIEDLHTIYYSQIIKNYSQIKEIYKKYISDMSEINTYIFDYIERAKLISNYFDIESDENKIIYCLTFLFNTKIIVFDINMDHSFELRVEPIELRHIEQNVFIDKPNDLFWCTINYNDYDQYKNTKLYNGSGEQILFHNFMHRFSYFHECGHNFQQFDYIILNHQKYNCIEKCVKLKLEQCKYNNFISTGLYSNIDEGYKDKRNPYPVRDFLSDLLGIHIIKKELNEYFKDNYKTYCVINQILQYMGDGNGQHFSSTIRFLLICYHFSDLRYSFPITIREKHGGYYKKYLKYKQKYNQLKTDLLLRNR
jgi:hypothetical protein